MRDDAPKGDWRDIRAELSTGDPDLAQIYGAGQRLGEFARAPLDGSMQNTEVRRIAIVGGLTSDFVDAAIGCGAALEGDLVLTHQAPYGAWRQELLDLSSGLYRFRPDFVVIAPDWRTEVEDIPLDAPQSSIDALVAEKVDGFVRLWSNVETGLPAKVIQHTLVRPPWRLCGLAERMWRGSYEGQVAALGAGLFEAGRGRVTWVELDRVAARVGLDSWFDEGGYYSARLPFRLKHLPDYMHAFRAAWRSANARVKKVLVLDLDNTLWGGVIGDAGVDGIVIGPGSATGEAFQNWGLYLKRLRARGVTLAVCSRNDPELAAAAFDHAGMVLKRTDFAAFDCSWGDKAAGLKRIAGQVGVGVDSLVFADDNPAECEQVRGALPDVGVVHLGADPARFIALLDRGQWFDLSQYTAEDMSRSSAYAARASAKAEAEAASDISTFLGGLRMVGKIATAGRAELGRLAQLEQKTNQFNLTTRRYTEADLTVFIDRPDAVVLALWLADKFGDHGLVSSLIGMIEGDALRIDSWLMSCRVFSRTAEQFAMRRLIEAARTRGASRVVGEYIPTKKNAVVSDLFERLGFARVDGREGLWTLDIRQAAGPAATETWIADHDDDSERAAAE